MTAPKVGRKLGHSVFVALAFVVTIPRCGTREVPTGMSSATAGNLNALPATTSAAAASCSHPLVVARCASGWCEIPAGCFAMGSPEGEWGHAPYTEKRETVTLTRAFLIQQAEVTRAQWAALGLSLARVEAKGCSEGDCPVANVTWFEAAMFANRLSLAHEPELPVCYELRDCKGELGTGMTCAAARATSPSVYDCDGYRLPTDAEWEYAARAGTKSAFYSGEITAHGDYLATRTQCRADPNLERIGWYCHNSGGVAHPVRRLEPNAWGLYDMAGNVAEWNNDRADGLGATSPLDPGGAVEARPSRNVRGGGYFAWASLCRMADQNANDWKLGNAATGFRLVRTKRR